MKLKALLNDHYKINEITLSHNAPILDFNCNYLVGIYLNKVNNRKTRAMHEICSNNFQSFISAFSKYSKFSENFLKIFVRINW